MAESALIVGAGSGLSAALARLCAKEGMKVGLAAREVAKLEPLLAETGARAFACDAAIPEQVAALFAAAEGAIGPPDLVIFNAGYRTRGPVAELNVEEVRRTLIVSAFAGFLVGQ